jgi:large subunit ribosomal protein L24
MLKKKIIFEGKLRLKKGDEVEVLAGKDKGRRGKIQETLREEGAVLVENINMVTRHQKPSGRNAAAKVQSGAIQKPAPLPVGKVMLVCPKCGKPTRVGEKFTDKGEKSRMCKHCHELIDA